MRRQVLNNKTLNAVLVATLAVPALVGIAGSVNTAYADEDNAVAKTQIHQGWVKDSHGKWWYGEGNAYAKNKWVKSSGSWYYLKSDHRMAANEWVKDGNTWYLLGPSGAMLTGWQKTPSGWYYLNGSGAMQTGWLKYNGSWYYLDPATGAMKTGWYKDAKTNIWYCSAPSGAMYANKWIKGSAGWYYLSGSGAMATNAWVWSSGKCYYLTESGLMAANTVIDGKYYVDANGAWDGKTITKPAASTGNTTTGGTTTTTDKPKPNAIGNTTSGSTTTGSTTTGSGSTATTEKPKPSTGSTTGGTTSGGTTASGGSGSTGSVTTGGGSGSTTGSTTDGVSAGGTSTETTSTESTEGKKDSNAESKSKTGENELAIKNFGSVEAMKEFLELWDSTYKWQQSRGNNSKIVLVRRKLEDGNFYDREGNEYHPFKMEETELGPIYSGFVPSGWTYKDFLNRKNGSGYDWGTVKYPDGSVRPMFYKEFSVSEPGGVKYDTSKPTGTQEGYKNAKMKQVVEDLMKHGLNKEEAKFAYFVNEYRESKGLPKIKVSKMLVLAERKHQQDFTNHLSNYYEGQALKPIRADLQDCWSDDNRYNWCEILHSNHSMKWDVEKVFNIWMSPNFYGERLKNLLLGEESDLVIGPAFEDGALVTCAVEAASAPRSNLVDASEDEVLTSLKGFYAKERAAIRSINAKWYEHLREKYGIEDVVGIEVYDDPTRIALEKAYHDCLDIIEIDY